MLQDSTSQDSRTNISELGEQSLIDLIREGVGVRHQNVVKGIGDDCAVLQTENPDVLQLVSSDSLIEFVHFDRTYVPAQHLGWKAALVNISDIYAMNGWPQHILLSLSLPAQVSSEFVTDFLDGFHLCCTEHNVQLIGGDTTASRHGISIGVTVLGSVEKEKICYRSGAQAGDFVCVSGDVGAAYMGLMLLEREKKVFLENPELQPDFSGFQYVLGRQLRPNTTRLVARLLADAQVVPSSMIDLSDGLGSELNHIANASSVDIRIFEEKIPIDFETVKAAELFSLDHVYCALHGGEDYELLFTVNAEQVQKVKQIPGIAVIGHVLPGDGQVGLIKAADNSLETITPLGFSHFGQDNHSAE